MRISPVSARYATALFELAREKGQLERVAADVERIRSELSDAQVSAYLFDGRVEAAKKRARLETLVKLLSPLTANFVRLLSDKRRLDVLRDLAPAFRQNLLRDRNATEGYVESARPLGSTELADLAKAVGKLLGKSVELENRVRPELLAGVRLFVDNKLIDQSATGRLEGLRGRLLATRLG